MWILELLSGKGETKERKSSPIFKGVPDCLCKYWFIVSRNHHIIERAQNLRDEQLPEVCLSLLNLKWLMIIVFKKILIFSRKVPISILEDSKMFVYWSENPDEKRAKLHFFHLGWINSDFWMEMHCENSLNFSKKKVLLRYLFS